MKSSVDILITVLLVCLSTSPTSKGLEADLMFLDAFGLHQGQMTFEPGGNSEHLKIQLKLRNAGVDDIPGNPANTNFDLGAMFSESSVLPNSRVNNSAIPLKETLPIQSANFLASSDVFVEANLELTFPIEGCSVFSHLCIVVENKTFHDPNLDNNYICLKFDDSFFGAGVAQCPSDIKPVLLNVTSPYNYTYQENESTCVTFSVSIVNTGGAVVRSSDVNVTHLVISSGSELTGDDDVIPEYFIVNDTTATNLNVSLSYWEEIQIDNLTANLLLPSNQCDVFKYLCIIVIKGFGKDRTDLDGNTCKLCVEFGNEEVGHTNCTSHDTSQSDNSSDWLIVGVLLSCTAVGGVLLAVAFVPPINKSIKRCLSCKKSDNPIAPLCNQ